MRKPHTFVAWLPAFVLALLPANLGAQTNPDQDLAADLRATETAFAATMAQRDLTRFADFIANEAVFFSGDTALRGREAIVTAWRRFFEAEEAPFSWEPAVVEVLDSGDLGLTSGPVLDPTGERIGTFNSVWRRTPDGSWQIVFDRGCDD
jgi:ketosteroid isomerase-like protein